MPSYCISTRASTLSPTCVYALVLKLFKTVPDYATGPNTSDYSYESVELALFKLPTVFVEYVNIAVI